MRAFFVAAIVAFAGLPAFADQRVEVLDVDGRVVGPYVSDSQLGDAAVIKIREGTFAIVGIQKDGFSLGSVDFFYLTADCSGTPYLNYGPGAAIVHMHAVMLPRGATFLLPDESKYDRRVTRSAKSIPTGSFPGGKCRPSPFTDALSTVPIINLPLKNFRFRPPFTVQVRERRDEEPAKK